MTEKKNKRQRFLTFGRGDFFLAVAIALAAAVLGLGFLFPRTGAAAVEIRQNGVLLDTIPLDQSRTITVEGAYTNVIAVENGSVSMKSSTCPGADCVHTGQISKAGQAIVCLPNRVEIRLTGGEADFVDMAVG